jgi:hypothetical protein
MSENNPENTNNNRRKPPAANLKPAAKPRGKTVAAATGGKAAAAPKSKSKAKKTLPPAEPAEKKDEPIAAITEINTSPVNNQDTSHENTMEVQHHPQLDHKPKPWKEYLLEGFMIFIAVMMGFIAENIRETITNNQHVRQLTTRLVQDLKVDSAWLASIDSAETKISKSNDTLFALLQQPLAKVDTKKIQQAVYESHSVWLFHPSAVSVAAIKNELYLKQFSDSEIIGYIATYERHIELLHTAEDITFKYQRSFLDPFLLAHFTPANLDVTFNRRGMPTAQMRNLTQDSLTQLAASVVLIRINTNDLIRANGYARKDVANLLKYVTKQYHLAD